MNNRDYKQFAVGSIYHVYNRGVGKMNIFNDQGDYVFFLRRIKESIFPKSVKSRRRQLPENAYDLLFYCLMPNHFHLCISQNTELPISALMLKICTSYSKTFNKKYNRVGSLFQDQFKAVPLTSNGQLLWLSSYIHMNPIKAGLVTDLEEYQYSSYPDYIGLRNGSLCKKDLILSQFKTIDDFKKSVILTDDKTLSGDVKID